MIIIRESIDEIINSCFSPEDADILEFNQNGIKVTIKDQFFYHYETACYTGTLDNLKKAIMYKIHQHQDLLLKIKDYKENIQRILDLGEYSRVSLGYRDQLGTETSVGGSKHTNTSQNLQTDQYSGVDQNENVNIADERKALSQTNVVNGLKTVIPQPSITQGEVQHAPTYATGESFIFTKEPVAGRDERIQYTKPILNNPQMEDAEAPIGYQNLSKDITTNQTNNIDIVASSRGSHSTYSNDSNTSSANIKGSKLDEVKRTVEYITNDARLKLWKTELPKLRLKFWNIFFNLFLYEQY